MGCLHVRRGDGGHAGGRHIKPVGMRAVHSLGIGTAHHAARPGVRLLERCNQALPLALPDGIGESRFGDLTGSQRHSFVEQAGLGQGAQRKAQGVGPCPAAKLCTQISPGVVQIILTQRRRPRLGQHTFVGHARHHAGQPGLGSGVTATAAIKVDLHIDHGNHRAFHQIDTRTVGLGPVLNRNGSECRALKTRCKQKNNAKSGGGPCVCCLDSYRFRSIHGKQRNGVQHVAR